MKDESVDWPVHLETSMISSESLMSDLTVCNWGRRISDDPDEDEE